MSTEEIQEQRLAVEAAKECLRLARTNTEQSLADSCDVLDHDRTLKDGVVRLKATTVDANAVFCNAHLVYPLLLAWLEQAWGLVPTTSEETDRYNLGAEKQFPSVYIAAALMRHVHTDFAGQPRLNIADDQDARMWVMYVTQQWLHYAGQLAPLLSLFTEATKDVLLEDHTLVTSFLYTEHLDAMILFQRTSLRAPLPLSRDYMHFLRSEERVPASTLVHAFDNGREFGIHYKQKPDLLEEDVLLTCYKRHELWWSIYTNDAYETQEDAIAGKPLAQRSIQSEWRSCGRPIAPVYSVHGQPVYGSALKKALSHAPPNLKRKHAALPVVRAKKMRKTSAQAVYDILVRSGFWFGKSRNRGTETVLAKKVSDVTALKREIASALGCLVDDHEKIWVDDDDKPPASACYAVVARKERVPEGFTLVHDGEKDSLQIETRKRRTSILLCVSMHLK